VPENVGVVDAGVILTRLDPRRRSHSRTVALFGGSASGESRLHISAVNLAEALAHGRPYTEATGVDIVAVLTAFGVTVASADADMAVRVARLSRLDEASLADRFALATAQTLGARLHTTDRELAAIARRVRLPVTLY
jgi:predicted nucleic acid-binding protein